MTADDVPGLQHERTQLAWERTAIALMIAGVVLTRYAAEDAHVLLSVVGIAQTAAGGALLLWASRHHDMLHNPRRPASAVPQAALTRLIGAATVLFSSVALVLAVLLTVT